MRNIIFGNEVYYHVYNRGVDKRVIYNDEHDKRKFVSDLHLRNQGEMGDQLVRIISYALMENHYHLLLQQVRDGGISLFMQKIGNGYTKHFNNRHDRTGRLFQGPYGIREVTTDGDLMNLTRYIHRNPRALTSQLEQYRWSSYPHYLGRERNRLVESDVVMNMFTSPAEYRAYVREDRPDPRSDLLFDEL